MTFTATSTLEYTIVRDYYVSNNHLQGIYFILQDDKGNILTKFLGKELLQNHKVWKKKGSIFSSKMQQLRFEKSSLNLLVVENGLLKQADGKVKKAERITFCLK